MWSKIKQSERELNTAVISNTIHSDMHRVIHRFCGQLLRKNMSRKLIEKQYRNRLLVNLNYLSN